MRHVTIEDLKFFNGKACVNRRDGAKLVIESYIYIPNREPTDWQVQYVGPESVFWAHVEALVLQTIINEFRKGGDFKEGD